MKRMIVLSVLATVIAGPAAGGEPQTQGAALVAGIRAAVLEAEPTGEEPRATRESTPGLGRVALAQQARSAAQRPSLTRRRRGSMVGYIDDAAIESKVRLRYDSGFNTTAPDRAEFFYAKCGCYSGLPAAHPAFDADAPGPQPGAADDLNFQQFVVEGEYAVDSRVSIFGVVPFRRIQPQSFIPGTGGSFPDQSGAGDVRAGVKLGIADTAAAGVTAKFQVYFPTGDAGKGMGTNHASFEPAFLFHNSLSDVVEVESQVGVWIPIGGSAPVPTAADGHFAGRVFYYGIGPSFTIYDRNRVRFAPVVELVGWRVLSGNESVGLDASGTNIVNLKVGGRLSFDAGSIYVGYGHALTDATWYDDILRFEYRYAF
jgi:hypothetical protein